MGNLKEKCNIKMRKCLEILTAIAIIKITAIAVFLISILEYT